MRGWSQNFLLWDAFRLRWEINNNEDDDIRWICAKCTEYIKLIFNAAAVPGFFFVTSGILTTRNVCFLHTHISLNDIFDCLIHINGNYFLQSVFCTLWYFRYYVNFKSCQYNLLLLFLTTFNGHSITVSFKNSSLVTHFWTSG